METDIDAVNAELDAQVIRIDRVAEGAPSLRVINPASSEGQPVPERRWMVQDMIPAGAPTLLGGEGAAGKSVIGLQLCAAMATGKEWLGTMPTPGRSLYLSAEDDVDELHRRLDRIRKFHAAGFADLGKMRLVDLVGENAVLGSQDRSGLIEPTEMYRMVMSEISVFKPDLVLIDALADAFGGDENSRSQARQFNKLNGAARQFGCTFLVISHPSLTGINSGSGLSGSTAWNNSVRSRLYLEGTKAGDGSEPDPDLRILSVKKANYSQAGKVLTIKYRDGVFVAVRDSTTTLDKMALEQRADETFLRLLRMFNKQGQHVGASSGANYAPAKFAEHPEAGGVGKRLFADAMQRLLANDEIGIEEFGPPSRRRFRLISRNG